MRKKKKNRLPTTPLIIDVLTSGHLLQEMKIINDTD